MSETLEELGPSPITELTKGQRRVLGTLLEKAFTTPEAYPLTVKALTAGCNQKSNRHPMTEYSEDEILEFIDQLRQMGLVAVVHTETGRTERFRHYMRKRFTLSEPQLAILTELLLRGRQSVGDLRARASRMVAIPSLDELRTALLGLMEQKYVQSNGALERRGVEVDHNFYQVSENKKLTFENRDDGDADEPTSGPLRVPAIPPGDGGPVLQAAVRQLQDENRELHCRVDAVETELRKLSDSLNDLVRELRG